MRIHYLPKTTQTHSNKKLIYKMAVNDDDDKQKRTEIFLRAMTRFGEISLLSQIIIKSLTILGLPDFLLGKFQNQLWQIPYAIGKVFFVLNGQILNHLSCHLVTLSRALFISCF